MVMQWTVNPPSSGTTGSIPVQPTIFSVFSKMDITGGYGPPSGSSILSGPAIMKHIIVHEPRRGPKRESSVFHYGGLVLIGNTCALQA